MGKSILVRDTIPTKRHRKTRREDRVESRCDNCLTVLVNSGAYKNDAQNEHPSAQALGHHMPRLLGALNLKITNLCHVSGLGGGKYGDCQSQNSQKGEQCTKPRYRFHQRRSSARGWSTATRETESGGIKPDGRIVWQKLNHLLRSPSSAAA